MEMKAREKASWPSEEKFSGLLYLAHLVVLRFLGYIAVRVRQKHKRNELLL